MDKLVSVLILSYNSASFIERRLRSLGAQSYRNLEVIVTDNESKDRTREVVEEFIKNNPLPFPIKTDWQPKNLGYGGGRNGGIVVAKGEYILCLNHDAEMDPEFIATCVRTIEGDEKIAAIQGKLLQAPSFRLEARTPSAAERVSTIDTVGLVASKSRKFANRGHAEEDRGQYEKEEEVFGVDGAAAFYRRAALDDVKLGEREYFDGDFFLYKEDIDLSWRLRLAGWNIVYQPKALAYNERSSQAGKSFFEGRRLTPAYVRKFSFRNYHFLLAKDDRLLAMLMHAPWVLTQLISYWALVIFFEPKTLATVPQIFRSLPNMLRKRRIIMQRRRAAWEDIYKWFK